MVYSQPRRRRRLLSAASSWSAALLLDPCELGIHPVRRPCQSAVGRSVGPGLLRVGNVIAPPRRSGCCGPTGRIPRRSPRSAASVAGTTTSARRSRGGRSNLHQAGMRPVSSGRLQPFAWLTVMNWPEASPFSPRPLGAPPPPCLPRIHNLDNPRLRPDGIGPHPVGSPA